MLNFSIFCHFAYNGCFTRQVYNMIKYTKKIFFRHENLLAQKMKCYQWCWELYYLGSFVLIRGLGLYVIKVSCSLWSVWQNHGFWGRASQNADVKFISHSKMAAIGRIYPKLSNIMKLWATIDGSWYSISTKYYSIASLTTIMPQLTLEDYWFSLI